jgi:hypothetical protein
MVQYFPPLCGMKTARVKDISREILPFVTRILLDPNYHAD